MNVVETRGLVKRYRRCVAVDGFDMRVAPGDIYGFVGKNGAGKSSVMKLLCGLASPTAGTISLFGGDPSQADGRIGALIENPGLVGRLSARDNLVAKALACGVANPKAAVAKALDQVGLSEVAGRKAKEFSLGMKQRLGLALALIGSPDLLLLDEPLNGLDPEGARAMRSLLVHLNQAHDITIIISSHVLEQLDRIATRYGVISAGRMVREMTAEEVQAECGDSLRLRTADSARTLALLEEALPQALLRAEPDGAIRISGDFEDVQVSQLLRDTNQTVLELSVIRRDIEEYFLELMEGGAAQAAAQAAAQVVAHAAAQAAAHAAHNAGPTTPVAFTHTTQEARHD